MGRLSQVGAGWQTKSEQKGLSLSGRFTAVVVQLTHSIFRATCMHVQLVSEQQQQWNVFAWLDFHDYSPVLSLIMTNARRISPYEETKLLNWASV